MNGRPRIWIFFVAAAAVALLAAAVAWAGGHRYAGTVAPTGSVKFTTKTSGGHLVVAGLAFEQVPTHCKTGPRLQTFSFPAKLRVKSMRFHGLTPFGDPTIVVVAGRFNDKLTRATGTASLMGEIGPHTGCHTGTLRWSARSS